jgi:hypothetical protein
MASGIWTFYRKLIVPALSASISIGFLVFLTNGSLSTASKITGFCYLIFTPVFHFFNYEIVHPNEYYFYYNMGISKLALWLSTLILSFLICLIMIVL